MFFYDLLNRSVFRTLSNIQDEVFAKIVNDWKSLTTFRKTFILAAWQVSSLIYNTNAKHERNKCGTSATSVRHERYGCNTRSMRVLHKRQECDTGATRTTRVRHEWNNFDFDNYKSKNIFSHSYIYYMASERLQGEKPFHSKYYLWQCLIPIPKCVWKVHNKNWTLQW